MMEARCVRVATKAVRRATTTTTATTIAKPFADSHLFTCTRKYHDDVGPKQKYPHQYHHCMPRRPRALQMALSVEARRSLQTTRFLQLCKSTPFLQADRVEAESPSSSSSSSSSSSGSGSESPEGTSSNNDGPPSDLDAAELEIYKKLTAALKPSQLSVRDVSGGCGSMYALEIVSSHFNGLSRIKQHRLVNEILKEEVKGWHGLQLRTSTP